VDKLLVYGPARLSGSVEISSAKNSTLKLMAASLLSRTPILFKKIPKLRDLNTMRKLLTNLGAKIEDLNDEGDLRIDASQISDTKAHYDIVKTMRASILVLGPLLTRFGEASVSLPGGCAIGARPIDIHLKGLEALGAEIELQEGYVTARAKRLVGANILLSFPSVGATENILMAAVFAKGETVIENAAREPEIIDLVQFLVALFPELKILGAGTSTIRISGIERDSKPNHQLEYRAMGDRIEAATYLIAGMMTKSPSVTVNGIEAYTMTSVLEVLKSMGAIIEINENKKSITLKYNNIIKGAIIDTAPFPGLPTDVQAQLMALMICADSSSVITEHIFENRFMHVPEMQRMGAAITLRGNVATIQGGNKLKAAPVMCTDLRASAALVLCGLVAEGTTEVQRIYHLDRGYEKLEEKLKILGAKLERIKSEN